MYIYIHYIRNESEWTQWTDEIKQTQTHVLTKQLNMNKHVIDVCMFADRKMRANRLSLFDKGITTAELLNHYKRKDPLTQLLLWIF